MTGCLRPTQSVSLLNWSVLLSYYISGTRYTVDYLFTHIAHIKVSQRKKEKEVKKKNNLVFWLNKHSTKNGQVGHYFNHPYHSRVDVKDRVLKNNKNVIKKCDRKREKVLRRSCQRALMILIIHKF